MAFSEFDETESQTADRLHSISQRNDYLRDDLKMRLLAAFRQWERMNSVRYDDPTFDSFGKRSQDCLHTVFIGRICDAADAGCADYLPEEE